MSNNTLDLRNRKRRSATAVEAARHGVPFADLGRLDAGRPDESTDRRVVLGIFDPEDADRSLGTLMILDHIERAKKMGLAYVYLGYWVSGSRKMDYKGRYLPQERLMPQGWTRVES